MYANDQEHRIIGCWRICYTLKPDGGGAARHFVRRDGKPIAPIKAQVFQQRLAIRHGIVNCTAAPAPAPQIISLVRLDVTCSNKSGEDSASCDRVIHGNSLLSVRDERFPRVSVEHCN